MATIGLDSPYYAPITEASDGTETYGTPVRMAKAMTAEMSVEVNEATLYADDAVAEVVKEFKNGTISLGVDKLETAVVSALTGGQIDSNGVIVSASENTSPAVAVGFRARKSDGKYCYYWLYRVIFGIPATSLATQGDSITFSTPTIEGVIYRRNKPDGQNKHPWKVEANEGDANLPSSVLSSWFESVYEPSFNVTTVNVTTQPQSVEVTLGSITESLDVVATAGGGSLAYQWYSNTINSNLGGTAVSGATSASMSIPTDLPEGSYYYYCSITSGETTVKSNVAVVTVA